MKQQLNPNYSSFSVIQIPGMNPRQSVVCDWWRGWSGKSQPFF